LTVIVALLIGLVLIELKPSSADRAAVIGDPMMPRRLAGIDLDVLEAVDEFIRDTGRTILSRDGDLFQKLIDNFLGRNSLGLGAHRPDEPVPERVGSDALDVRRQGVIPAREKSRGARERKQVLRRARRSAVKNHFLDNGQARRLAIAS